MSAFQTTFSCNLYRLVDQFWLLTFIQSPSIEFFNSPLTQPVRLHLTSCHSLCLTSVTYRTPCHAISTRCFPQPLLREAEKFPKGGNHSKRVLLLTNIRGHIGISYINFRLVFKHDKTKNILLAVKSLAKKHNKQQSS